MASKEFVLPALTSGAAVGIAERLGLEVLNEQPSSSKDLVSLEIGGDDNLLHAFVGELRAQGVL